MLDDLRHFNAGVDKRRLAVVLSATAVVMLSVTGSWQLGSSFAAPQASPPPPLASSPAEAAILVRSEYAAMRSQMYESVSMAYGRMKAACMAGDLRITWVDPHTRVDMAAACDVVALGRIPK